MEDEEEKEEEGGEENYEEGAAKKEEKAEEEERETVEEKDGKARVKRGSSIGKDENQRKEEGGEKFERRESRKQFLGGSVQGGSGGGLTLRNHQLFSLVFLLPGRGSAAGTATDKAAAARESRTWFIMLCFSCPLCALPWRRDAGGATD